MVPLCTYGPPHVLYDSYGPTIPYIEQVSCGHPTCMYGPPHVLYDSYGPLISYIDRISYMTLIVPHTLYGIGIILSPTCLCGLLHM